MARIHGRTVVNREQLAHVLRAAAQIVDDPDLVDVELLLERVATIDRPEGVRERVRRHIQRCVSGGFTGP